MAAARLIDELTRALSIRDEEITVRVRNTMNAFPIHSAAIYCAMSCMDAVKTANPAHDPMADAFSEQDLLDRSSDFAFLVKLFLRNISKRVVEGNYPPGMELPYERIYERIISLFDIHFIPIIYAIVAEAETDAQWRRLAAAASDYGHFSFNTSEDETPAETSADGENSADDFVIVDSDLDDYEMVERDVDDSGSHFPIM